MKDSTYVGFFFFLSRYTIKLKGVFYNMSIEERVYQSDFWGEQPELPQTFPPVMFGGENHWEKIEEKVICDVPQKRPAYYDELETGFGQCSDMSSQF